MGLTNEITVHKKRISFKLGAISIEIDEFEDWGTYIEAEIIGDNPDKKELFDLFESLGISKDDVFEKGYITLILEEKNLRLLSGLRIKSLQVSQLHGLFLRLVFHGSTG